MDEHLGFTQSIRQRLKFTDEYKWKRFSARRLELIDNLALSNRKASEQDDKIYMVANTLREEYGFPIEALPDFDNLVRAGIQSVRRNRKRVSKKDQNNQQEQQQEQQQQQQQQRQQQQQDSSSNDSDKQSNKRRRSSFQNERISISSLLDSPTSDDRTSSSGDQLGPPMNRLSINNTKYCNHLIKALTHLSSFISKLNAIQGTMNYPALPNSENNRFIGESVINLAAGYAIQRLPDNNNDNNNNSHYNNINAATEASRRSSLLSTEVLDSLLAWLKNNSITITDAQNFKTILANCSRAFGFEVLNHSLSNIYYELINLLPENANHDHDSLTTALAQLFIINLPNKNAINDSVLITPPASVYSESTVTTKPSI